MVSAKLNSNQIAEWIGEVCDELDRRWQSGCYPNVDDVLPPDAEVRGALLPMLRELLAVDLEYRWRQHFSPSDARKSSSSHRRPWFEDYIRRYPILTTSPSTVIQLLKCEFRTRQIWGDRPSIATFIQRFPKLGQSLMGALREVLAQLVTMEVKAYRAGQITFSASVFRPLSVGRQRGDEPVPVWMDQEGDVDRLVIAPAEDRSVSRTHARLELVAVDRLIVVNCSDSLDLHLGDSGRRIIPGEVFPTCAPVSVSLGTVVIRLTTSTKIPNLDIHS